MALPSPPIFGPPYEDVAGRTEKLAEEFAGYKPPPPAEMDAGRALIRIFERMARHVIERINRVPEQSFAAFLDRVGALPAPTRAARVPLTFSLVERSEVEPIVPAGTRVGAAAAPGDTREVVFETEIDLATTRAQLVAVIVRQPDGDRLANQTAAASGGTPAFYEAFDGGTAALHALYLAADNVLGLVAGTQVTVAFSMLPQDVPRWQALHAAVRPPLTDDPYYSGHVPDPPLVRWKYYDGKQWTPLSIVQSGTTVVFSIPANMAATSVNGKTARWIRAELLAWPKAGVPSLQGITMSATQTRSGLAPSAALSSGRPVDLSVDSYPLGERPRLNDMFSIACDEVLSRPGASVTVQVTQSANADKLTANDKPVLAWEVSTKSGWTEVTKTSPSAGTPIPNDALRTTSFTVPNDVAPAMVGGKSASWLRIRLASGSYGKGLQIPVTNDPNALKATNDGYRPPILTAVTLAYTVTVSTSAPLCVTERDFGLVDRAADKPLAPFVRGADSEPALYLGFDRPFAPRDTLLYLQVPPLAAADAAKDATASAGPRVAWEYAEGPVTAGSPVGGPVTAGSPVGGPSAWAPLVHQDETRDFAASGVVRFVGPPSLVHRAEFGKDLYWLRARLKGAPAGGSFASPRLGRILTNTVWASDAALIEEEILGSGDGRAEQSFLFAQRPVLEGQRVEVREPAVPSLAEREEIERLEGPDAITVVVDPERPDEVWVRWHEVPDFYASISRDRHYTLDRTTGQVRFGDGQRGMPPPRGARNVRAASYRTGGGADGNRPSFTISQLKTTISYIDGVMNHEPSRAGADRESVERVKDWGPRVLRHGHRAVTAEDFEDLARAASPAVARARAVTPSFDAIKLADTPAVLPDKKPGVPEPGGVVLLIATTGPEMPPTPSMGLLREVEAYVRSRSGAAVALRIAGPAWIEVSADRLTVVASSPVGLEALRHRVDKAITAFLHPLTGGFDGTGWDFGEMPHASDVYRLVMSIPGVDRVGALTLGMRPPPPDSEDPVAGRVLIYPGVHTIRVTTQGGS